MELVLDTAIAGLVLLAGADDDIASQLHTHISTYPPHDSSFLEEPLRPADAFAIPFAAYNRCTPSSPLVGVAAASPPTDSHHSHFHPVHSLHRLPRPLTPPNSSCACVQHSEYRRHLPVWYCLGRSGLCASAWRLVGQTQSQRTKTSLSKPVGWFAEVWWKPPVSAEVGGVERFGGR